MSSTDCSARPSSTTQLGGSHGGGAVLTTLGSDLIARFRALEQATAPLVREHLGPLEDLVQSCSRLERATAQSLPTMTSEALTTA